jgi:hypothetical protein
LHAEISSPKINLVMSDVQKLIDEFWDWFLAHRSDFDTLKDPNMPFWNAAVAQLKSLDGHLWFELSSNVDGTREFIITAEGHHEAFPIVEAIAAQAPKVQGWKFIALKPPMGFEFVTNYEGIPFDPNVMWFLPLKRGSNRHDLGLRIGVPNLSPANKRQAENAVLIILDTALGERVAALDIGYVEVAVLPESPRSEGYLELKKLPSYIEWHKRKLLGT